MSRLIWSPPALLDVQRLYRFLAPKNIDAAKRAVKELRGGVRVLALQPGIGRPVEDMEPEYGVWGAMEQPTDLRLNPRSLFPMAVIGVRGAMEQGSQLRIG